MKKRMAEPIMNRPARHPKIEEPAECKSNCGCTPNMSKNLMKSKKPVAMRLKQFLCLLGLSFLYLKSLNAS